MTCRSIRFVVYVVYVVCVVYVLWVVRTCPIGCRGQIGRIACMGRVRLIGLNPLTLERASRRPGTLTKPSTCTETLTDAYRDNRTLQANTRASRSLLRQVSVYFKNRRFTYFVALVACCLLLTNCPSVLLTS